MSGSAYAIFIGINEYQDKQLTHLRYAQKDCEDLCQVLTDPQICNFSKENTKILTGPDATKENIEEALYTYVVKNRNAADTILVYFSGHGFFAGEEPLAYIGTYDVSLIKILRNPHAGLRMEQVYECFKKSNAKHVLFILDCCHSGALAPSSSVKGDCDSKSRGIINPSFFSTGTGRIALFACPADAVSRESDSYQNGIFTHFLIRGLKGEALEQERGEVTLDSLFSYVNNHVPPEQPAGRYGQSFGRIVLSKPGIRTKPEGPKLEGVLPRSPSKAVIEFKPLNNPLEPYIQFIEKLRVNLEEISQPSEEPLENRILEAIRRASDVDFVFVLRLEEHDGKEHWNVRSKSEISSDCSNPTLYMDESIARVQAPLSKAILSPRFDPDRYYPYEDKFGVSKSFIIVSLRLDINNVSEFMIVDGFKIDSVLLEDVYIQILSAVYSATRELTSVQAYIIEDAIIDSLKRSYGYVSLNVYNRRFESFRKRLVGMDIYFEPILYLEPGKLHICGWEALARDPVNIKAPIDLFETAELWGDRFITELDLHFLRTATQNYQKALKEMKLQRPHEMPDLSINVYPQSLMRTVYYDTVAELLHKTGLMPERVILEISEKAPIPDEACNIDIFKQRLEKYVRELRIGFSIDDFGVGHASVARLVKLNPMYIKIDREVLHIHANRAIISFVIEVAHHDRLHPPKVIIEGFDNSGSITLNDLYHLGIRYVQGYIVGKAGQDLYRLTKDNTEILEGYIHKKPKKELLQP